MSQFRPQQSQQQQPGSSFRPKETIFELLGGGGTEAKAKGDMEQVMGAVRKRARVHRLLTRHETTATDVETAAADAAAAAAAAAATSLDGEDGDGGDAVEPMDVESGGGDRVEAAADDDDDSSATTTPAVAAARANASAARAASAGGAGSGSGLGERNRGDGNTAATVIGVKRKLSRFERKRLKKSRDAGGDGSGGDSGTPRRGGDALAGLEDEVEKEDAAAATGGGGGDGGVMGNGGPGKFADKSFYIGYGTT